MAQINPGRKSTANVSTTIQSADLREAAWDRIEKPDRVFRKWQIALFWSVMFVFAFHACTHMVAAGDTWVALACGRHFVQHGVDTVEPFSFNSHKAGPTEETIAKWPTWAQTLCKPFDIETIRYWHPTGWINQNWLTHVMFYWLAETFGSDGQYHYDSLVYWKFGLYFLEVVVVYLLARTMGASVPGSVAAASFAMFVGRSFFDIRPAGFANLMVPLYLLALALAVYRNVHWIWLMIPVTVFWANVHGGYIYVFIMLVPFVMIHLLTNLPKRWTVCACSILSWLVLFAMVRKFTGDTMYKVLFEAYYRTVYDVGSVVSDGVFWMILLSTVCSIGLSGHRAIRDGMLYGFHILVTVVIFSILFGRVLIPVPTNMNPLERTQVLWVVESFQTKYVLGFFAIVIGSIVLVALKPRLVRISNRRIGLFVAAGAASFVAMVLFNPFRLTNLTHTFEISVSEHAASWRTVNEWRPAFDWMDPRAIAGVPNPVGDEEAFGVMCVLGLAIGIGWIVTRFRKPRKAHASVRFHVPNEQGDWPRMDIAMSAIIVLTVIMAIQSRRFIPIAASVACPLMALFFEQMAVSISAWRQEGIHGNVSQPSCPKWFVRNLVVLASLVLVGFGGYTAFKYKRIYLDPWIPDGKRDSIFMRMTASNVKPFDAGRFIRDNQLTGNMFNYWTEGGAIAFFQSPDPATGRTPLQLFMDGRAQAAYNHDQFERWMYIKGGGPVIKRLADAGKELTDQSFADVGKWINEQLTKDQVWVILMPTSEVPYPGMPAKEIQSNPSHYFIKAIQTQPNWALAYLDDFQYLYIRTDTEAGKNLLRQVLSDEAKFPTEFSRNLTLATLYFQTGKEEYAARGFEHARQAFALEANQASALRMVYEARRYASVRQKAEEILRDYLDDFLDQMPIYANQGGYTNRLVAARIAANGLITGFQNSDPSRSARYRKFFQDTENLPLTLSLKAKW